MAGTTPVTRHCHCTGELYILSPVFVDFYLRNVSTSYMVIVPDVIDVGKKIDSIVTKIETSDWFRTERI